MMYPKPSTLLIWLYLVTIVVFVVCRFSSLTFSFSPTQYRSVHRQIYFETYRALIIKSSTGKLRFTKHSYLPTAGTTPSLPLVDSGSPPSTNSPITRQNCIVCSYRKIRPFVTKYEIGHRTQLESPPCWPHHPRSYMLEPRMEDWQDVHHRPATIRPIT